MTAGGAFTITLSLVSAPCGTLDLPDLAFDDIEQTISDVDISVEGVRTKILREVADARDAFEVDNLKTAEVILCTIIREVEALPENVINPAATTETTDTVRNVAEALGMTLKC